MRRIVISRPAARTFYPLQIQRVLRKTGTFERPSVRFEAQLLQLPEIHNALRAVLIDRLLLFL